MNEERLKDQIEQRFVSRAVPEIHGAIPSNNDICNNFEDLPNTYVHFDANHRDKIKKAIQNTLDLKDEFEAQIAAARNTLNEEKLKDKVHADGTERIKTADQDCLDELAPNQLTEMTRFKANQLMLESAVNDICANG